MLLPSDSHIEVRATKISTLRHYDSQSAKRVGSMVSLRHQRKSSLVKQKLRKQKEGRQSRVSINDNRDFNTTRLLEQEP